MPLFDFSHWKKHLPNPETITDFELNNSDSFVFKGDNLPVMKAIRNVFNQKIKLIYIDPPYNTGNNKFQYDDNLASEHWLTFMEDR
jgi:adenine-specific DNA-methyltransferase